MTSPALDDLSDRLRWLVAQLKLKTVGAHEQEAIEVLRELAAMQLKITARLTESATPMHQLSRALELSDSENMVVTLLVGYQLHPWVRTRVEALMDDRAVRGGVSSDAIRVLVYGTELSAVALHELGTKGRLRRFGVLERVDSKQDGIGVWSLSSKIVSFLVGDRCEDSVLAGVLKPRAECRDLQGVVASPEAVAEVRRAVDASSALVCVSGLPGSGRRSLLAAAVQEKGSSLVVADGRRLSRDVEQLARQLRAIAVECRLANALPLISDIDDLRDDKERLAAIGIELLPLVSGPVFVTCGVNRPTLKWDRPTIVIEMGQPTTTQRATLWHSALGQGTAADAQLLAEQYPLAPALICNAAEAAKARANGRPLEPDDIYAGIRSVLDDKLGQFAKRVTVTQTWDDLVLPPDQLDTIIELMARVRGRSKVYEQWGFAAKVGKGLGVSALFSGPPGTGKTMVAALIARDLGLELYQVDMAKIVSKFIGETEKNLGALFDAAEAGHAILLFDEADALFGKRTDVKSSNDRYANLETNYLLQRLETFTGICLLTSNHESHIDPAFQRRLSLHLRFDVPDVDERAQLWRATLPAAAPVAASIDFESLARRYAMSGGYIRNAALRAAFLAADEDSEITAAHLERAARVEYEGLGKIAA